MKEVNKISFLGEFIGLYLGIKERIEDVFFI